MSDTNGSARNVTTPRLGLNKPAVGADLDIWGDYLNSNCDTLDNSFLVTGGVFSGAVGGYPASSAGAPAFSVGSGAGIYAMGASMGVAAFNTNVFTFSLSSNTSAVPLNMTNNRINNVGTPLVAADAVNLGYLNSSLGAYLPLTGSPPSMLGPISMGGNLINNLALPQNPGDATSKQYVDALIADMRLFVDTWQVAANIPDISNISSITAGDYYIAVTANPTVPETAPSNIPGIGGMTINNGDMVIYSEAAAQYELVRGGPLTVAEADALFVNKAGDTMSGGLTVTSTSGITVRTPLGGVQGINYDGFGSLGANIAFGISQGVLYVYQNALAVAGLVNLSGGTMTGLLLLSGNATQPLGATTLQQVQSIAGNYLPQTGGQLSGKLTINTVSESLELTGIQWGRLRTTSVGATPYQYCLGTRSDGAFAITDEGPTGGGPFFYRLLITPTGAINFPTGTVTLPGDPVLPLQAATKQYVDAQSGGGGDFLPLTGGTIARHMTTAATDANLLINATCVGAGVNGPLAGQFGLSLSLYKDGWFDGTAAIGEIDGLIILARQGGVLSDCCGILVNVVGTGTGFLAINECLVQQVEVSTGATIFSIREQTGGVNTTPGSESCIGEHLIAEYGNMTTAIRTSNTSSLGYWGNVFENWKDGILTLTIDDDGNVWSYDSITADTFRVSSGVYYGGAGDSYLQFYSGAWLVVINSAAVATFASAGLSVAGDVAVSGQISGEAIRISAFNGYEWQLFTDDSGNKYQMYRAGWYDEWQSAGGARNWVCNDNIRMSLDSDGNLDVGGVMDAFGGLNVGGPANFYMQIAVSGPGINYTGVGPGHYIAFGWDGQLEFYMDGGHVGTIPLQSELAELRSELAELRTDINARLAVLEGGAGHA